ncbi:ribose 5-phosphate isomerase [Neobacillus cucumis]|nr:ribose 5-phosphate isomerase [Neobacillus cucumis]
MTTSSQKSLILTYPADLERELNLIPGVVDNGLFIGMATIVITLDKNKEININLPK